MNSLHNRPIGHDFYLSLMDLILAARQRIIAIGSDLDLTAIQAITIFLLDESSPRPMKSLCGMFHCDASNITGIIDGLEKKGLVSRKSDTSDRRIKTIQLEPAGRAVQRKIIDRLSEDSGFVFDSLDGSETQQFVRLVEKISAGNAMTEYATRP